MRLILTSIIFCATAGLLSAANAQGSGSYGIEYGTGRVICTDDADAPAGGEDESYARARAWDRRVFGPDYNPCGPELTDLDPGTWKQTAPFKGADETGKFAEFRIYVLHDTFSWRSGSSQDIMNGGEPADPADIFNAPNFFSRLCSANAAFGLGSASSDGDRAANRQITTRRAATIVSGLDSVRSACPDGRIPILFGVSLGEHEDSTTVSPEDQRRVMIIAADEITLGVNFESALRQSLRDQDVFNGLDIDRYDIFDIVSY